MSAQEHVLRGRGGAGAEQPNSSKLLSNYRRPAATKKARAEKAKRAALVRWSQPEEEAATTATASTATASASDDRTVQWGELCTVGAMAGATHAVEHLLAEGVLKAAPHAGSRRLRAVAAAVLATELGPERQLGGAELIRLAHGFARCQR